MNEPVKDAMNEPVTITLSGGPLDGQRFGPMVLPDRAFTDDSYPFTSYAPPAGQAGKGSGRYQVRRASDGMVTAVHVPGAFDKSFTGIPPKPQPAEQPAQAQPAAPQPPE